MSESLIEKLAEISVRVFTIGRAMGDKDLERLSAELNSLSADIAKKNWHTGTPAEEEIDKDNQYCYALCFYYDGWWLSDYLFKANHEEGYFENSPNNGQKVCKFKFSDNIAWQKIEPFKEIE